MDKQKLISAYSRLDALHIRLGMTLHQRQHQISVYGRSPLHVHSESSGANANGEIERFTNNDMQVTVRLDGPYVTGCIVGDESRDAANRILLLSCDRNFKSISSHRNGRKTIDGFVAKSPGEYKVTEAFQTLVGNYTLPQPEERALHPSFKHPKWTVPWDFQKIFAAPEFKLNERVDEQKFDAWDSRLSELIDYVDKTNPINGPMCYIDLHKQKSPLTWYFDCCWPVHHNNTFFAIDEVLPLFAKPVTKD